ncbi:hypothetical protein [Deltalipothrixvirus pozzuoliense]|uniref:Uncharacterized protein ORF254 n=1 Tax=Acidianus filamentous virus 2 (isolate Italy/Pozzuoli) TaxID=654910 RepID=Y254_AFV2P|nr:hypothetical protein AFV2_gp44 [Acidianus filamentous virus 2]Q573C5.1 RecName: Full=Uncharacterized protein ORF254 [Acidianus filamentous virus 2 (isolate Pozzuoli)]CAH69431.1 hypothetical protein [Acidianus filamentous virus 2]
MKRQYILHVKPNIHARISSIHQSSGGVFEVEDVNNVQYNVNDNELSVKGNYIGGEYGEMIWNIINTTNVTQYVALVRGATIKLQDSSSSQEVTIPDYLFGRAFAEVYFNLGISQFGDDATAFETPYTLAVYNGDTIGFVFAVKPYTVIHVPEYGFTNLVSYTARLLPVKLGGINTYIDFYDYSEVVQYQSQTGYNINYMPDPIVFSSIQVKADANLLGYGFHERLLLPIPTQWLNIANDVATALEKLKSLSKLL